MSSFGFSGTNAHVVLEEFVAAELEAVHDDAGPEVVLLSGRTAAALAVQRARLADWVEGHAGVGLRDVAQTLARGRVHFGHRAAWVVGDRAELLDGLRSEAGFGGALGAGGWGF